MQAIGPSLTSQDAPSWGKGHCVFPTAPVQNADSLLDNAKSQIAGGLEQSRLTVVPRGGFRHVRELLVAIERRQRLALSAERTKLEMQWLREHQVEYAGRWVALIGDTLLAAANSAREAYAAIGNPREVPVIVRVEPPNEVPFAGW